MRRIILIVLAIGAGHLTYAQTLPVDPDLRTGKLANGFTYYIRRNEEPKKRVELYLVNKVGSVLENDNQQGLAHFMEHMNFNGTKNYPKNELVDYLQKAGVRFGADLNAYTTYDETVYQLPIPTDDPSMFGNGLKIMRDWAQEATLDPVEIDKERGVVLEEERLRKGAGERMSRQYFPMLLNHSRYAERTPIGQDSVLTQFKSETIKQFHHEWYRPDLQALVVVGDVNVDEAEKLIRLRFSNLVNPVHERERIRYTIPLTGKTQFKIVTDKEATGSNLQVIMKYKAPAAKTENDYLADIKYQLLNEMLRARRTAEVSRISDPAFTGVDITISTLLNDLQMFSFSVSAKSGMLEQSFEQGWRILETIKRYGFSQQEFDRAKKNLLANLQNQVNESGKIPSPNYVKEYVRSFLQGEATPGIVWEYEFVKSRITQLPVEDINHLLNELADKKNVDILISAPDQYKSSLPDSAGVKQWMDNIHSEDINPFKSEQLSKPLLASKPNPGKVISREEMASIGATMLVLNNGIHVILKPTDFKNDQILYGAFKSGGTSLYDAKDYDMAANAAGLIGRMGSGNFNPIQLSELLTGKAASSSIGISTRAETITGSATPKDLEIALQLTYMQITSPRKDTSIFKNTMSTAIDGIPNRYANPAQIFADTVAYVMGSYNYRSAPPTIERLKNITLDRTFDIYKERFADASGFTFVFVGSFKTDAIIPLINQYIGSLPGAGKKETARDLGIHIPAGNLVKKIYKGTENKATVRLVFSGTCEYNTSSQLQLKALEEILQIKVLQQMREAEGQVYAPQVQSIINKYPQSRYAIVIQFGCAAENVDHLINIVKEELKKLRENGPGPDDIAKFKAQYEKSFELAAKSNGYWYSYLLTQSENKENPGELFETEKYLRKIDAVSIKKVANIFLSTQNMISFELLPEVSLN